jgi:CubicO group peptidase (beta-lactamase class C family)
VVAEWYGGGFGEESLFEIGSIRKSFNSALIGWGLEEGRIDLEVKAYEVWPELLQIGGQEKDRQITLHHLAGGTSGWLTSDPPGTRFLYNNAAFTAAERVVARLNGFPNDEIAAEVIRRFRTPLEANSWRVYHFPNVFDAGNIDNPGPKLAIDSTLRDLSIWGELWLNGKQRDGKQLIPNAWLKKACSRVNDYLTPCTYGYNWFLNHDRTLWPQAPEDSFGHAGWGTFQSSGEESRAYLWVCPSLDTVAVMVTDAEVGFANDFLEVPMGLTAEWIGRVAEDMT